MKSLKTCDKTARYTFVKAKQKSICRSKYPFNGAIYSSIIRLFSSNFLKLENIELKQYSCDEYFCKTN